MDSIIVGTEIKFAVDLSAEGFSMNSDNFTLSIYKGKNIIKEYAKSDLIVEDGVYLMCVDTAEIGVGTFDLVVYAEVPDTHFSDNIRKEIQRISLVTIKKL